MRATILHDIFMIPIYVVNISHCESVWSLFTIEFKAHAPPKNLLILIWHRQFYKPSKGFLCLDVKPSLQAADAATCKGSLHGKVKRWSTPSLWLTVIKANRVHQSVAVSFHENDPNKKRSGLWLSHPADTSWADHRVRHDLHLIGFCWHNEPLRSAPQGSSGCGNSRESK